MIRPALAALAAASLLAAPAAASGGSVMMHLGAEAVAALQTMPSAEARASLERRADRACRVADARLLEERRFAKTCAAVLVAQAERRLSDGGTIIVRLAPSGEAVLR